MTGSALVAEMAMADLSEQNGGVGKDLGAATDGAAVSGDLGAVDGGAASMRDIGADEDSAASMRDIGDNDSARGADDLYGGDKEARDAPPDDLLLYAKEFASTAAGQLYLQMQKGDMRAIKLYYDLEERGRRAERTRDEGGGAERMARIAAVRRAVFGEDAMEEDRARALEIAQRLSLMGEDGMRAEVIEDDGDIAADEEAETDV